jgi:aminopeptidase N
MHRTLIAVAAALLLGSGTGLAHSAAATAAATQTTTQLPRGVQPLHYDVVLTPQAQSLGFTGNTRVTLEIQQTTRSISLHAAELKFQRVQLLPLHGHTDFGTPKIRLNAAQQTASFQFGRAIPKGRYTLVMDYSGVIGTQAAGLFALDYDTSGGKRRALYTQFENSDARRVLPCWDEPQFKATFALEAVLPAEQLAVSNMPVASRSDAGAGLARVRFATTPKMSTYLLFFGTGEFDRATTQLGSTEIGIVTKKGSAAQGQLALESSKAVLAEFNDYFGLPYPLPKLDNVAAPGRSQFFAAMENWGAIFTFEYGLLVDPAITTVADRQYIFTTAAHEIAHQWFGNLVTMRWWDDLWLNEGFASWMENRMAQRLHPEWNTVLDTVASRERAMARDALKTTHPVVQHVATVEQASQAFDDITYQKGEAVVRMLEAFAGETAWRDGVRAYMKKHAYGSTVSDDLWREIDAAAGQPVSAIAHDFTLQPGIPLVRVAQGPCVDGHSTLSLQQGEFSLDQPGKKPLRWQVPVMARALGTDAAVVRTLLRQGQGSLDMAGCGPVVVNAGQTGYYRTLYAPEQLATLSGAFAKVAPIDQLGLLADGWALALAGLQPVTPFLDMADATPGDAAPQVWGKIAEVFDGINTLYRHDPARRQRFAGYASARLGTVLARLGWQSGPNEADSATVLRTELIRVLSDLGDPAVIAEARRRYAARNSDPQALPAALLKTVLGVVARHADAATWEALLIQARSEPTPLVKDQLYELLATPEDAGLAQRALDLALTPEVGATNSAGMLQAVARLHPELAFDFALAHREAVNAMVDSTSRAQYFPGLAASSGDATMLTKLDAYARQHLAASSRQGAQTALAQIRLRLQLRHERLPAIDAWLARRKPA